MTGETVFASNIAVRDVQEDVEIDNTERTISATLQYLSEELITGYHHYLVLKFEGFAEGAEVELVTTNVIPANGYVYFGIDNETPDTLTIISGEDTITYTLDLTLLPESDGGTTI